MSYYKIPIPEQKYTVDDVTPTARLLLSKIHDINCDDNCLAKFVFRNGSVNEDDSILRLAYSMYTNNADMSASLIEDYVNIYTMVDLVEPNYGVTQIDIGINLYSRIITDTPVRSIWQYITSNKQCVYELSHKLKEITQSLGYTHIPNNSASDVTVYFTITPEQLIPELTYNNITPIQSNILCFNTVMILQKVINDLHHIWLQLNKSAMDSYLTHTLDSDIVQ